MHVRIDASVYIYRDNGAEETLYGLVDMVEKDDGVGGLSFLLSLSSLSFLIVFCPFICHGHLFPVGVTSSYHTAAD